MAYSGSWLVNNIKFPQLNAKLNHYLNIINVCLFLKLGVRTNMQIYILFLNV